MYFISEGITIRLGLQTASKNINLNAITREV